MRYNDLVFGLVIGGTGCNLVHLISDGAPLLAIVLSAVVVLGLTGAFVSIKIQANRKGG